MKKIILYNVYSFLYLWNTGKGNKYITNLINMILNNNENYSLKPLLSDSYVLKSYLLFESKTKTILVDFNYYHNYKILGIDKDIMMFNKYNDKKENILIIFNSYTGKCFYYTNFYIKLYNVYSNYVKYNLEINRMLEIMDTIYLDKYLNEMIIHKRINDK